MRRLRRSIRLGGAGLLLAVGMASGVEAQPAPVWSLEAPFLHRLPAAEEPAPRVPAWAVVAGGGAWEQARARWAVRPPARARTAPPAPGDTLAFNVPRLEQGDWAALDFILVASGEGFRLWVETGEWHRRVDSTAAAALAEAIGARTPAGSIDPNRGILANTAGFFGELPDYDGDGVLDLLWFDIVDPPRTPQRRTGEPAIDGLIRPEDFDPDAPAGTGNQADVVYLDVKPTLTEGGVTAVAEAAAGLIQQLIHFNLDPRERPFMVAGLAEWTKVLNGYDGRGAAYLRDRREHNVEFASFGLFTGDFLKHNGFEGDFQRTGLFTGYLVEQFGLEFARQVIRIQSAALPGTVSYQAMLDALGETRRLEEVIMDFHTANYVNDRGVHPRYGYQQAVYADVQAIPSRVQEGAFARETPPQRIPLANSGVQYLAWENVEDFSFVLDVITPVSNLPLRIRAVKEAVDGTVSIADYVPTQEPVLVEGTYARVTLIVTYTDPFFLGLPPVDIGYFASWAGTAETSVAVSYDNGEAASDVEIPNFITLGEPWQQATRFAVPPGGRLRRVFVAPLFLNQFASRDGSLYGTRDDPRDFRLHVWAIGAGGLPGEELYAANYEDPRPFASASSGTVLLDHISIELPDDVRFVNLPDTIFVGLSEAGSDGNSLVMVFSEYADEDVSALSGRIGGEMTGWFPLWNLAFGETRVIDRAIPTRVLFTGEGISPVVVEDGLPPGGGPLLHPNYPNPFNPRTHIQYTLAQAQPVTLAVYDVLGRRVAVLVEGVQAPGTHTVGVDAEHWASGTYICRLETPGYMRTRLMVLAR